MKQSKKNILRLRARIDAWMASPKMQKDQRAFKKPGSMKK